MLWVFDLLYILYIYITTSLPKTMRISKEYPSSKYIRSIINNIDGLNVSLHSIYNNENNKILNASSKHDRLSILRDLLEYTNSVGDRYKIRVCMNLVKGGIECHKGIEDAIGYIHSIGCFNIKLNELQHSSDLYVSFDKVTGSSYKSPYSNGCQTTTRRMYHDGIVKVTVKRSCFLVEESNKASIKDLIKIIYKRLFYKPKGIFRVMYEDGSIHNKWEVRDADKIC